MHCPKILFSLVIELQVLTLLYGIGIRSLGSVIAILIRSELVSLHSWSSQESMPNSISMVFMDVFSYGVDKSRHGFSYKCRKICGDTKR